MNMGKENSTLKKVLSIIGNVIIWVFVAFSVVITILTFASQSSEDGLPSVGSITILTVSSDSMYPTFEKGDIIIGKKVSSEDKAKLKKGDVITYDAGDIDGDKRNDFNTHRIVEITTEDGVTSYTTKGDNNKFDDNPVNSENVVCKYTGTRIKGVGKVLNFLQTPKGFLVCVVLPLILLFMYELIRFIRKLLEVRSKGESEITEEDKELIRQQAIEEYLRSKGEEAPAEEATAEEAPVEEAPAEEPKAEE